MGSLLTLKNIALIVGLGAVIVAIPLIGSKLNPSTDVNSSGTFPNPAKSQEGQTFPNPAKSQEGQTFPNPAKSQEGQTFPNPAKANDTQPGSASNTP